MKRSFLSGLCPKAVFVTSALSLMMLASYAQDVKDVAKNQTAQARLVRDVERVDSAVQSGNLDVIEKLSRDIKYYWHGKDIESYAGLTLGLAQGLHSFYALPSDRARRNLVARKMVFSLLQEDFEKISLRLKVLSLETLSDLSYDNEDADTAEANRFKEAGFFIQTDQLLDKAKKTNLADAPLPKTDLTKYNWGKEIMISGMSPQMIKDPELRRAYQAAMNERAAARSKARERRELSGLEEIFSRSLQKFFADFHIVTEDDKAKAQQLLDSLEVKSGRAVALLQAKANTSNTGVIQRNAEEDNTPQTALENAENG